MKTQLTTFALMGAIAMAVVGCDSGKSVYVDPGGPNTVVTLDQINIQDWNNAAQKMTNRLLQSNSFQKGAGGRTPIYQLSNIVNATSIQIDTNYLTKNIADAIRESGQARRRATEDTEAAKTNAIDNFAEDRQNTLVNERPDYTLTGRIMEDKVTASKNLRQTTYTFQLTLTDRQGIEVWGAQEQIAKQGDKPQVGW